MPTNCTFSIVHISVLFKLSSIVCSCYLVTTHLCSSLIALATEPSHCFPSTSTPGLSQGWPLPLAPLNFSSLPPLLPLLTASCSSQGVGHKIMAKLTHAHTHTHTFFSTYLLFWSPLGEKEWFPSSVNSFTHNFTFDRHLYSVIY